jgi:hypothetical protein
MATQNSASVSPVVPTNTKMTVESDGIFVTIKMPIDLLVWSQEHRDEPFKIVSKSAMVESMILDLLDFDTDDYSDGTEFHDFLDSFFDESYEQGKPWLVGVWDIDEEPSDEELNEIEDEMDEDDE